MKKWFFIVVFIAGCDCSGPPQLISDVDGCKTYRIRTDCSSVYFTKCKDGSKTDTQWEQQEGKAYKRRHNQTQE